MRYGRLSGLLGVALLAACGGGGGGGGGGNGDGGTLHVALSWPGGDLDLFKAATVVPVFSGFEGHAPNCTLTSGRPPAGMTLQSDCTVVGRPTEAGNFFNFSVRVGASGVSNTVDSGVTLRVRAPTVTYAGHANYLGDLGLGATVNDRPSISGWTVPADVTVAWAYTLMTGSLPPGLMLDASTGAVTGTASATGSFNATIRALLKTSYGNYETSSVYSANVNVPGFSYMNTGGTGASASYQIAYVSQPFKLEPKLDAKAPSGSTLSAFSVSGSVLPAGLTLDATTGIISGSPTTTASGHNMIVLATITTGIGSSPTQSLFSGIEVRYPVSVEYPLSLSPAGSVGVPLTVNPRTVQASPLPLVAPTFSYAGRVGQCDLPPGMTLNPTTGIASGTPTTAGSYSCIVDVTITNNGTSWASPAQIFAVIQ
jgi:hypothetical protein